MRVQQLNNELDMYSQEYAQYIMDHAGGDVLICNGDTLLQQMEAGYLFDDYVRSQQLMCEN